MTFFLTITEKGGKPERRKFEQHEVTVGRVQGNDIVLPKGNISKRHSRIVLRDTKFIIVDLKSTNGTYVNGRRISAPQVLKGPDKVYIGDFTIQVESDEVGDDDEDLLDPSAAEDSLAAGAPQAAGADIDIESRDGGADEILFDDLDDKLVDEAEKLLEEDDDDDLGLDDDLDMGLDEVLAGGAAEPPTPAPAPAPKAAVAPRKKPEKVEKVEKVAAKPAPKPAKPKAAAGHAGNGSAVPALELSSEVIDARRRAYEHVKSAVGDRTGDRAAVEVAAQAAVEGLKRRGAPAGVNLDAWKREIVDEMLDKGALTQLLEDDQVTAVYVNGPFRVFVERGGERHIEPVMFSSAEALVDIVARMVRGAGTDFSEEHPIVEARLPDGTRMNAVHTVCAANGPVVTVTRPGSDRVSLDDLEGEGVLSAGMVEFIDTCVRSRRNIIVCGVPGARVAGLTGAVADRIGADERIVVVEPVPEIELHQAHVVNLEARAPSRMRDLVANALRMHPDRLVVHELAGPEAFDTVLAMGGGQQGTIVSMHASSAHEALARISTMMVMAGHDLAVRAMRQQIAENVDIVICLTKFADGTERITEILEVTGAELDLFTTQEIFAFKREGGGKFAPKGEPRFYQELKQRGESLNMSIFRA